MSGPRWLAGFDPVTLQILWGRLIAIADQSSAALVRASFSTHVRESNDFACALLDERGNALADSTVSIPAFLGVMPRAVQHIVGRFPLDSLSPGDAIICNDPWVVAGHLNDFILVAPIFHHGKLVAFAANIAHAADVGGGTWSADAREIYEEGLRIVPSKLMKAGVLNTEVADLIRANVRVPDQVMGDFHAQVAAAEVCSQKLVDFLQEQRMDDLSDLGSAIHARAEAAMRRAIETIPDGEYRASVETDGLDTPLTICIKVIVEGSDISVDYTGTSPQVEKGINSVYGYTYAYTAYPLKCLLDPFTPKNEGSFRPITVTVPEGTILNPRYPAAVGARYLTSHFAPAALFSALAPALPDRVIAHSSGPASRLVFSGTGYHGRRFSQVWFPQGGMGARPNQDGLSCTAFPTNAGSGSAEVIENLSPLLCRKQEMIPDSGGPGRFRGGLGQEVVTEVRSPEPVTVSVMSERLRHPPLGILGGHPGSFCTVDLNHGDPVPEKGRVILREGDIIRVCYSGGGGYGPPTGRDRNRISEDLKNELITPEAARTIYGLESQSD